MRSLQLMVVIAAALVVGCSTRADGPPEIEVDRTTCDHCRMLISEPRYAAAYQAADAAPRVFDDIGCLLDAARQETSGTSLRFWFHDAGDASWIEGAGVTFVRSAEIRTPMSGGIAAYRDPDAAGAAARRHGGHLLSWEALLARKESGS